MCLLRSANQHRAFEPNRKIHFEAKMESIKQESQLSPNGQSWLNKRRYFFDWHGQGSTDLPSQCGSATKI
jgi:hypothetical protein